ncbi:MAG: YtxH domain-containing protein [Bacteroidota bacterium]|jgi:uncharacterized membrane-anchored protein YhcB (DUF1043 family)
MEEKKSGSVLPFLLGAAVGAAVGYLIASGKAETLLSQLKEGLDKGKEELDKQMSKGREILDALNDSDERSA